MGNNLLIRKLDVTNSDLMKVDDCVETEVDYQFYKLFIRFAPIIKREPMTLGEFFQVCSQNSSVVLFYFIAVPLTALLAWVFGKGEGHLSPWKYLYSTLVYLACIPGIFVILLDLYLFLFERRSVMDANIFTQILPVISMLFTLWLVRRNVCFDDVPGFDKIGSLIFVLTIIISMLWILEKTHIVVFSYMPFYQFILLFVVGIILLRFGLKRVFG